MTFIISGYIFGELIFERDISSGTIDQALAVISHITGTSLSRCLSHILLCDITLEVFFFSTLEREIETRCPSLYQCSTCSTQPFVFRYLMTHLTFYWVPGLQTDLPHYLLQRHKRTAGWIPHCSNTLETSRRTKGWTGSIRHTSELGSRLRLPPSSSAGRLTVIA